MKLCFLCDLHLPFDRNALQYDVLEWSISKIKHECPQCVIFAGDITSDGNADVFHWFLKRMKSLNIPFLFIPGNSDLRCQTTKKGLSQIASSCENKINDLKIFAVNDCTGQISEEQFSILERADDSSIVFMHHPIDSFAGSMQERLLTWRKSHKKTKVFYGHLHCSNVHEANVALQALDPDKAIGEPPCLTLYDTDTKALRKVHYPCAIPSDLREYFGISCYDTMTHIRFATEHHLKYLELRPYCIQEDSKLLAAAIANWRTNGGENLCIHLPDVEYVDGTPYTHGIDRFADLARHLHADRFTQHVPKVPLATVYNNPLCLESICDYLAEKLNAIEHEMVIGIENMHMTANESPDDTRRFGYIPEECITFMKALASKCLHKVGINFDIGHARNNMPYSQTYQISTWLSQLGQYVVGYHIHQVTLEDGVFHNHMPITDVYGRLISFASLFQSWNLGKINKAPIIFEINHPNAYEVTLNAFQ